MKKLLYGVILLLGMSVLFSCSKEDASIIGTWEAVSSKIEYANGKIETHTYVSNELVITITETTITVMTDGETDEALPYKLIDDDIYLMGIIPWMEVESVTSKELVLSRSEDWDEVLDEYYDDDDMEIETTIKLKKK